MQCKPEYPKEESADPEGGRMQGYGCLKNEIVREAELLCKTKKSNESRRLCPRTAAKVRIGTIVYCLVSCASMCESDALGVEHLCVLIFTDVLLVGDIVLGASGKPQRPDLLQAGQVGWCGQVHGLNCCIHSELRRLHTCTILGFECIGEQILTSYLEKTILEEEGTRTSFVPVLQKNTKGLNLL